MNRSLWERKVASFYDAKKRDINFVLKKDGIVHHHNGIILEDSEFTEIPDAALLHKLEDNLTEYGLSFLPGPPRSVLDAGCGRGGGSILIAGKFPEAKIKALNISPYQISFARRAAVRAGLSSRISFIKRSMTDTRFAPRSFDFIWACESTEHIPDMRDWFSESRRLASPGGIMIIIAWVKNPEHGKAEEYAGKINAHYFTSIHPPAEYENSPGWKIIAKEDLTPRTVPYWRMRSRFPCRSGSEVFMFPAFAEGAVFYLLYVYKTVE